MLFIIHENNIQSNWQYRNFMTRNSESIRANLLRDALNDVGYSVRDENPEMGQIFETPKVYGSFHEPISHRQAASSDLKEIYMTREQLQAKQVVPSMTQDELVKLRGY